jgi:hypothetical protein
MRFGQRQVRSRTHPGYVGRHQAPRRRGAAGALAALLRGGVAALVAVLILGMLAIATPIVVSSSPPSPPGTAAPPAAPPTAATTAPPRPRATLIAASSFRGGVQPWHALAGSIFTRGRLGDPDATYARIQRDPLPINPPAIDPETGKPMVGIGARVPGEALPGTQVQAKIRVQTTKPGTMVVIRLSEWQGSRRVGGRDGRVTLLDTKWREITSDYRVAEAGSKVEVEILALALDLNHAMYIEPPVVTAG